MISNDGPEHVYARSFEVQTSFYMLVKLQLGPNGQEISHIGFNHPLCTSLLILFIPVKSPVVQY